VLSGAAVEGGRRALPPAIRLIHSLDELRQFIAAV